MFPERVLLLTWEYPPRSISPISHYCKQLADYLSSKGVDVIVLTYDDQKPNRFYLENDNLFVFTVGNPVHGVYNPLTWSLTMAYEMEKKALDVIREIGGVDLMHAQDWLTIPAALLLKEYTETPLFITFHSIEPVRVGGACDPYIEAVKRLEYEGCKEAEKIFVNNLWMKYQVMYHYSVPEKKVEIAIPQRKFWMRDVLRGYEVLRR
ncbi:MAG TPA: hypothetical protein ENF51_01995 [Candidatus Aenigmarchaeota archaeon]|nr:hypothetical protein [Candidatus Aenigmarchaeota archaeon]